MNDNEYHTYSYYYHNKIDYYDHYNDNKNNTHNDSDHLILGCYLILGCSMLLHCFIMGRDFRTASRSTKIVANLISISKASTLQLFAGGHDFVHRL